MFPRRVMYAAACTDTIVNVTSMLQSGYTQAVTCNTSSVYDVLSW